MANSRLDQMLVTRGLAPDLARARALILAGRVHGPAQRYAAPGLSLPLATKIQVKPDREFVSRGGLKLAAGLDAWEIDVQGLTCIDLGASTGGFTDCLLQRGAARVYAVDVGYGQLADPLRRDERVVAMERTDARALPNLNPPLDPPPTLAVFDLAFISLREALGPLAAVLPPRAHVVALVKPQFEAPRESVPQDGVVRSPQTRSAAVRSVALWALERGWRLGGIRRSPLRGPKGNEEFLVWLRTPNSVEQAVT